MLRPRRAADRSADAGMREHPGERERGHVDAALARFLGEAVEPVEDRVGRRRCSYGPGRCVMREPAGNAWPRRYLPVSQPPESGPNGT